MCVDPVDGGRSSRSNKAGLIEINIMDGETGVCKDLTYSCGLDFDQIYWKIAAEK